MQLDIHTIFMFMLFFSLDGNGFRAKMYDITQHLMFKRATVLCIFLNCGTLAFPVSFWSPLDKFWFAIPLPIFKKKFFFDRISGVIVSIECYRLWGPDLLRSDQR